MNPSTTIPAPERHHLDVPGARLYYELRGSGPVIVLVGAPMDADSFAPLADALAESHTVLTADPRGINRSMVFDREQDSTAALRAHDLAHLIARVQQRVPGPVAVLGSSGGAVTTLALMQTRPDLVGLAIVHEPPLVELLPDRDRIRALTEDYVATYLGGDIVGAWRKFFAAADIEMPAEEVAAWFGPDRPAQVLADERYWFEREMRCSDFWEPDLEALRAVGSRIVVGVGAESTGEVCDRTSAALAGELGSTRVTFVGDHTGFVDDPVVFADQVRSVLTGEQRR